MALHPLALALEVGRATLIASDASAEALELAAENLAAHGVESLVTTAFADLLEPAGGLLPRPDVVVANLPYVATRRGRRPPRVARATSRASPLDGGPDGLDLLRRLFAELPARVAAGATVLLEIGVGQVEAHLGARSLRAHRLRSCRTSPGSTASSASQLEADGVTDRLAATAEGDRPRRRAPRRAARSWRSRPTPCTASASRPRARIGSRRSSRSSGARRRSGSRSSCPTWPRRSMPAGVADEGRVGSASGSGPAP